ncbi:hypothetical protein SOVF_038880 [Spinacia oleracea]|nr:hypothetical protein SOVF_038880 [Spinacia oleracea]
MAKRGRHRKVQMPHSVQRSEQPLAKTCYGSSETITPPSFIPQQAASTGSAPLVSLLRSEGEGMVIP